VHVLNAVILLIKINNAHTKKNFFGMGSGTRFLRFLRPTTFETVTLSSFVLIQATWYCLFSCCECAVLFPGHFWFSVEEANSGISIGVFSGAALLEHGEVLCPSGACTQIESA
jgi:hypothetical protein